MEILILLVPLSVVLALLIGGAFWWSVRSGQFDDLEGPAHRIIADDDAPKVVSDGEARAQGAPGDETPRGASPRLTSVNARSRARE